MTRWLRQPLQAEECWKNTCLDRCPAAGLHDEAPNDCIIRPRWLPLFGSHIYLTFYFVLPAEQEAGQALLRRLAAGLRSSEAGKDQYQPLQFD